MIHWTYECANCGVLNGNTKYCWKCGQPLHPAYVNVSKDFETVNETNSTTITSGPRAMLEPSNSANGVPQTVIEAKLRINDQNE